MLVLGRMCIPGSLTAAYLLLLSGIRCVPHLFHSLFHPHSLASQFPAHFFVLSLLIALPLPSRLSFFLSSVWRSLTMSLSLLKTTLQSCRLSVAVMTPMLTLTKVRLSDLVLQLIIRHAPTVVTVKDVAVYTSPVVRVISIAQCAMRLTRRARLTENTTPVNFVSFLCFLKGLVTAPRAYFLPFARLLK